MWTAALCGGIFVFLASVLLFTPLLLIRPESIVLRWAVLFLGVAVGIGAALDSMKATLKRSGTTRKME